MASPGSGVIDMPLAQFTFNMSEPDDFAEYQVFVQAREMNIVLGKLDEFLRSQVRYGSESAAPHYQRVRDELYKLIEEQEVSIHA